jgi:hypothetical protein
MIGLASTQRSMEPNIAAKFSLVIVRTIPILAVGFLLSVGVLMGCSSTADSCSLEVCPSGCCRDGLCVENTSASACGLTGGAGTDGGAAVATAGSTDAGSGNGGQADAGACVLATRCVNDSDCSSGSRCNNALTIPSCQTLYCAEVGTSCRDSYFCATRSCASGRCFDAATVPPALGITVPATVNWIEGGVGGPIGGVLFTSDSRNNCETLRGGTVYGKIAILSIEGLTGLKDGLTVPWITENAAQQGGKPTTYAAFFSESLSGINLSTLAGAVTFVRIPTSSDQRLVVNLSSLDRSVNSTFVALPLCP